MYDVIKYERDQWGFLVLLKRAEDEREFYMDVELKDGDVVVDWNQYIFNLNDPEDYERQTIQDNTEEFDTAASETVCYLEKVGAIQQAENGTWAYGPNA